MLSSNRYGFSALKKTLLGLILVGSIILLPPFIRWRRYFLSALISSLTSYFSIRLLFLLADVLIPTCWIILAHSASSFLTVLSKLILMSISSMFLYMASNLSMGTLNGYGFYYCGGSTRVIKLVTSLIALLLWY